MKYYKDLVPKVTTAEDFISTFERHGVADLDETNLLADFIGHSSQLFITQCFKQSEDLTLSILNRIWGIYRACKAYLDYKLDSGYIVLKEDADTLIDEEIEESEKWEQLHASLLEIANGLESELHQKDEEIRMKDLEIIQLKAKLYDYTTTTEQEEK